MTDTEQREAARQFFYKWQNKGREDEDDRSYWIDILTRLLGVENVTDYIDFQKKVIVEGSTKRIDAYLPETRVLIEQKSVGKALDKKIKQSGDIELTAYEQAKRYNDNLPFDEKARWIVTSNFTEIWVYDMNERVPEESVQVIKIENLQNECYRLAFLVKEKATKISEEVQVSIKAGEIVGLLYDAFYKQYKDPTSEHSQKSLNMLCVRLVFCLYAEDSGLFGVHGMFHDYMEHFEVKDMRKGLIELFKVLDQREDERDPYLDEELARFPYVNGGLFSEEDIEIPHFTDEIKSLLLSRASDNFNWNDISPTIFGAVFESTLNPETRRSGGMHYTSIENIHKVIDPLFLDELKEELEEIKKIEVVRTLKSRLEKYQDKLASLTFLDPACGSGNFLTETYLSLRRLENEVLELKIAADKKEVDGQIIFGFDIASPIKVSIQQFYGIEINDFAVSVAMTALFIAEAQTHKETESIIHANIEFLPLRSYVNIVEGNALRMDWNEVVPKERLNYIMGNPPFVGHQYRNEQQAADLRKAFHDLEKHGKLDYVCGWYNKAADYSKGTNIQNAFVSTNSICQGESVAILWGHLFKKGVTINFAHQTFIWDSEANEKAHVHCVIIGFGYNSIPHKRLYIGSIYKIVENINGYLANAPNVFIEARGKCITKGLPEMHKGSQPTDGLGLILEKEDYDAFEKKYPNDIDLIRPYRGSYEFINNKERYCLWLYNVPPSRFANNPFIIERLKIVESFRKSSATKSVVEFASTPFLFTQIRQPSNDYLAFPAMSSSRRRYMPIGYISNNVIASNQLYIIPNATSYMFGVLTSNVHMAWMRTVCGRLKSDYRYAPAIYNNFPWPVLPADSEKEIQFEIEKTAQAILDARAMFPDSSLADLYDPLTMPPELLKAHRKNDAAVMKAYGFDVKNMSEADCVAELMKLYQAKIEELGGSKF